MRALTNAKFMIFTAEDPDIVASDVAGLPVAARQGHRVSSYFELLTKIAALSYHNSRFQLVFRGQRRDYKLNVRGEPGVHSCLYPSVLRPTLGPARTHLLDSRFERLGEAEGRLLHELRVDDVHLLRIVRWAILQHYEVCETPLLDVTLSLQTALSFLAGDQMDDGYLFVLALPHLVGPVSISMESMTQAVDLSQVCPPEALRPHFQSGMLVGDYPEYADRLHTHSEKGFIGNNFSCRLLTKFYLTGLSNWQREGFSPTPSSLLFPNDRDPWFPILQRVREQIDA